MGKIEIKDIPAAYFGIFFVVIIAAALLGKLPGGMVGGFAIMMALGYAFEWVGDRTPIVKDYLGGGPIICIFASAALVYCGIMPDGTKAVIDGFMKGGGFLTFYIASLIVGSILGIESRLLIKAGVRFAIPIICGLIVASLFAAVVAFVIGKNPLESIAFVTYPIMGGGLGAGVLPIAEIFEKTAGMNTEEVLGLLIPPMALGNVVSIIAGGLLYRLGCSKPNLTGNGNLMKVDADADVEETSSRELSYKALMLGIFTACTMVMAGRLLGMVITGVHYYALMIIAVAVLKCTNALPKEIEDSCAVWFGFMAKYLTAPLLVGVGVTYTDLGLVIDALSFANILLVVAVVLGAVIGAGLGGMLVGFYFIESAIAAGLCMANMGGTGDVAVLSAAKRMKLMPFAQISSRLGGALILVVVGLTVPFLL
ncbi:2-hydroxycarboxylate transporter family protein [Rhodobacteraceae bacterium RKSG542]|uniref:2-hydroxycarboxylate transporter family protein n=1 Tax=Pseudovibrio flavus TaxID=2529854 RepID=UPI0012BCDB79|nr:2-hydroxycarboxylate transporter family protein [Pseudovibrio flavus]MTI15932.1 2-hydroxycarboxylate transporter family protein [Pseudovibrio flavus]